MNSLKQALRNAWSAETCYEAVRQEWSADNPARGQCAVTALVVQDVLGGELLYCSHLDHYWNKLPDQELDLTREQFPAGTMPCVDAIVPREQVLRHANTLERYILLKTRTEHK